MSRLPGTPFSGCGTLGQSLAASELTFPSAQWMGGWERYKADHVGFWDKESDGGPLPLAQEKHAHAQVRACRSLQTAPPSLTPACVRSGAPPASHLRALGQKQVLESGSPVQVLVLSLSSCVSLDKSFNFSVPPFPQG